MINEERTRLHWVETAGGPHLVIPEVHASAWDGIFVPREDRVVEASVRCNPEGPATDYDRACSVNGRLDVLPVGKGMALVLVANDSRVAYYRTARGQHYLLQWDYAPSEAGLLDYFHDVEDQLPVEQENEFSHPGGKVYLMDSVDVVGYWMTPPAEFVLPRGRYQVLTSESESDEVSIIVHQFKRRKS